MKVLVTGASGFIGKHVTNALVVAGHEVTALSRNLPADAFYHRGFTWVQRSIETITEAECENIDVFIHLAATGVVDRASWDDALAINVVSSQRAWRIAANAGVRKFIICGSCFEYGRSGERYERLPPSAPLLPIGPYAASKAAASVIALGFASERDVELSILRPFQVYGNGEHPSRLWPSLTKAAAEGADFCMSPGEQVRDFIPVEQVAARFVEETSRVGVPGQPRIINIGTGVGTTLREFASLWWNRLGATGAIRFGERPYRKDEVMRYVAAI